jgi:hypothetical protein
MAIAGAVRNASQHCPISVALIHSVGVSQASNVATLQVAAMDSPRWLMTRGSQSKWVRSKSRLRCGCGSENKNVPLASQASPSEYVASSPRWRGLSIDMIVLRSND